MEHKSYRIRDACRRAREAVTDAERFIFADNPTGFDEVQEYIGQLRDISYCPPDCTLERWLRILLDHWNKTMDDTPVGLEHGAKVRECPACCQVVAISAPVGEGNQH